MNFIPALSELKELWLSHSSLALLNNCERKFEFRKFYRHSSRDTSFDGEVGNAIHRGMQHWLIHRDRERAIFEMVMNFPFELLPRDGHVKNMEACYATMNKLMDSGILDAHQVAQIKCPDGVTRPGVEVPFLINLKGYELSNTRHIPIKYRGYIDLVMYNTLTGEYEVFDIKTHHNNVRDMTAEYKFHEQCIPYKLVLDIVLGKPIDQLSVTYLSTYIDIEKPAVYPYQFEKTNTDIQEWGTTLLLDLQRIRTLLDLNWFPRRGNHCLSFRRQCEFFEICHLRDRNAIQNWLLAYRPPVDEDEFKPWFTADLELAA